MKIAIISRNWFTETKGGAERYIYELAKGLIDRGHDIITVSRQDSDLPNTHMKVWTPAVAMVGSALFSLLGARKLKGKDVSAVIVNQFWA
jgi:glycosyltransferase involved in cell wall biosynthesis